MYTLNYFIFSQKNLLLDFLKFEKVWFWDSCGSISYVSFSSDFGTTGVTKINYILLSEPY